MEIPLNSRDISTFSSAIITYFEPQIISIIGATIIIIGATIIIIVFARIGGVAIMRILKLRLGGKDQGKECQDPSFMTNNGVCNNYLKILRTFFLNYC